ncbi:MAG: hypothetical protein V4601_11805 [Pseudomonadota bacterium]
MDNLLRWRDEHHMLPLVLVASIVVLLAIIAAALWSRGSIADMDSKVLASRSGLQSAYDRVQPGTSRPQLVQLGFDSTRLKARSLSGLGVQQYFMPATSHEFDQLDPAVRTCFETPDRCSALIFPTAGPALAGGFMAAHAAPRTAERGNIVLLLKSGRVAYKTIEEA